MRGTPTRSGAIAAEHAADLHKQKYSFNARDYLNALRLQETHHLDNLGIGGLGDWNKDTKVYDSLGPYQIQRGFHEDAVGWDRSIGAKRYRATLSSMEYSERVIDAYNTRWGREQWERLKAGEGSMEDVEFLARTHNGGPRGSEKEATVEYFELFMGHWDGQERTKYNPEDSISVNRYPRKRPSAPVWAGTEDAEGVNYNTYKIKAGDSYWKISQNAYGKGSRFREILEYNGITSTNIPRRLVGTDLRIPITPTEVVNEK